MLTLMLKHFYDDFMSVVPLQLPQLLDTKTMDEPVFYEDYVLQSFPLAAPYSLEDVMNMLEDEMEMIILYHHIPSRQTAFGQSCCAYGNPAFGRMYKINARTNASGMVDRIDLTIYGSLEYMMSEVCHDLQMHSETGHLKYFKPREEVLLDFI